jgi:TRAP-type C4-dicarboxylate transport system substrate-binding protein
MARGLPRGGGGGGGGGRSGAGSRAQRLRAHPAVRGAQRLWPVALAAKQRWDSLTPEQQARVKRTAAEYAKRGRTVVSRRTRSGRP